MSSKQKSALWLPALVFLLALLVTITADLLLTDVKTQKGDDLIYKLMAEHPLGTHTFPFAYRIGMPWLVHILPFSTSFSFAMLSNLLIAGTAVVLYLLLKRLEIPGKISLPLLLGFVLSPPLLVVSIRQGYSVDPLTVFTMTLGALFIYTRNAPGLAFALLLGSLSRESALFMAPWAYAFWAKQPLDRQVLKRVALATLPALVLYVTLRLQIPTVGRESVNGYDSLLGDRVGFLFNQLGSFTTLRRVLVVFGPLWFLAPFALRSSRFVRSGLILLPLIVLSMSFAADWGRIVLVICTPLIYAAAALTLKQRPRLLLPTLLISFGVIVTYGIYMNQTGTPENIIKNPAPSYPVR